MVNIKKAAHAAMTAYGLATQQRGNFSMPLSQVASSLESFYLTNFTSFTLGQVTVLPENATAGVLAQLRRLNQSGIGTDVRPCGGRVEVVSAQSAVCWVTFEIFLRTRRLKPWSWTNVYGFRMEDGRASGLDGGWEFTVPDQEWAALLERVPNFFAGEKVEE